MKTIAFILSVIVVFSTTYSMILPAITLSDSAAEEEPGIFFEDTEELTAGEETEFTYEEEYTEEFPEEPETEPEAEAEPDPEWDYEYEEEAEEWDSDPGETEEVDDLALEGAEENLYEAEDAVTTEDGADDQPEAGQTEVQTEPASQDDAESVTVSPEVYEEFLTSEQSAQDGRYLIVRITDDGRYVAMNRDGAVVPVDYNADDNTASCDDENQELVWVKSGNSLHTPDDERYVRLTDESVGFSVVFDEPSSVSIEKPDDHQYAGAVYRTVVTDGVPEYYALVLSEDQTYFTAVAIDTKPVKRTILAKEAPSDPNESETESDDEPVLEEASLDTESAWETVSSEVESAVEMTVSEVDSVAEGVESEVDSVAEGVFSDAESAAEEVLTVYESGERTIQVEGADYTIHISWPAEAMIPEDAVFTAVSLDQKKGYETYKEEALNVAAGEDSDARKRSSALGVFDLTITDAAGAVIEPSAPVSVSVDFGESLDPETSVLAVHFPGTGEQPEEDDGIEYDEVKINVDASTAAAIDAVNEDGAVSFEADSFSVYVIVGTVIEKTVLASDGLNYRITATYGIETGIPEEADLEVTEILPEDQGDANTSSVYGMSYEEYVAFTENALGMEAGSAEYIRLFDIKIVDKHDHSVKYQPADGTTVDVRIDLADAETESLSVVHFADDDAEGNVVDNSTENGENGSAVEFAADGFSVYVVVDHEGGTVVTPRVEFHFIAPLSEEAENGELVGSVYQYTSEPYSFLNKGEADSDQDPSNDEYQHSQILKNGETLELIQNPPNKTNDRYFFGWYVVNPVNTSDSSITYTWTEDPAQIAFETPISIEPSGDLAIGSEIDWQIGSASGTGTVDEDGNAHVYLAPIYEDYYFVNFHLGPKEMVGTDSEPGIALNLMTRKLIVLGTDGTVDVRIGNIQSESPDPVHKIFVGWETVKSENGRLVTDTEHITLDSSGNEKNNSSDDKTGYYITVDQEMNIDLYPVYAEARWLYFNTGKSDNNATYVGAQYLLTSDDEENSTYYFDKLPTSTRNGFEFKGWYLSQDQDKNGTGIQITDGNGNFVDDVKGQVFYGHYASTTDPVSGETITTLVSVDNNSTDGTKLFEIDNDGRLYFYKAMDDLTLYAKWEEVKDSSYSVIIWKQKVSDDKAAADADKKYDYVESHVIESASGRTLQDILESGELADYISTGVNNKYTGFYYRTSSMSDETVKGDKTTVVNIYYDRELRAINYYFPTSGSYPADAETAYNYTATTGNNTPQYGLVGDSYVELTRGQGTTSTEYYLSYYENYDYEYTGTVYDEQGNAVTNPTYPNPYYRSISYYGDPYNEVYWRSRSVTNYSWTVPEYALSYVVDNENGTFGLVDGEYIEVTKTVTDYTYYRTGYTYTRATNNNGTQYGIVDGKIQQVYYNNNRWRLTNQRNGTRYDGYRYTSSNSNESEYTNTLYKLISGTAANNQSGFEQTEDVSGNDLYGSTGTGNSIVFFQLQVNEEANYTYVDKNGVTHTYQGALYSPEYQATGNTVEYTGTRFTRTANNNFRMITWTGLYGQNFAQNGYDWDTISDWRWREGANSGTYQTFLDSFIQDSNPYNLYSQGATSKASPIYHYRQMLNGKYSDAEGYVETAYGNGGSFNFSNKYEGFTVNSYSTGNNGFSENGGINTNLSNTPSTYPLHVYHTRNAYTLTFNTNYPYDKVIYFDGEQWEPGDYSGDIEHTREHTLLYEEPLNDYGSNGSNYWEPTAPDHYTFGGWYEDETCTVPFEFDSTMPSANKVVYAKWNPVSFRVDINPNGAVIDHSDQSAWGSGTQHYTDKATYINANYGTAISEYTLTRDYVPISESIAESMSADDVYYYMYAPYLPDAGEWGLHPDLRNAIYLKESELQAYYDYYVAMCNANIGYYPVTVLGFERWKQDYLSAQKYRKAYLNENYVFLGWFKDDETMPYNFSDPVEESFTLTAHWRLDGGYYVQYIPEYRTGYGVVINGDMETWRDPLTGATYSDQAITQTLQQPTGLTADGIPVEEGVYVFRGWRIVDVQETLDEDGNIIGVTYTPMEKDDQGNVIYHMESEDFVIEAKYADSNGRICLQAVYEDKANSVRRPEITNLTLDANTGFITQNGEDELETSKNLDVLGDVGTVLLDVDSGKEQIVFGDIQSNIAVHLDDYAVAPDYFKHPDGYFLLGFDKKKDASAITALDPQTGEDTGALQPFVPNYPADSVIAVQRTDNETLYAIWEPMVYLKIVNDTGVGPVTFSLADNDNGALYVVNVKDGLYDRTPLQDIGNITLPATEGENELILAIPQGAEKSISINGTNTLGTGKILEWNTSLDLVTDGSTVHYDTAGSDLVYSYSHTTDTTHSHELAHGETNNSKEFHIDETLITNAEPLVVTFTARDNAYALLLDDNYPTASGLSGSVSERDYTSEQVLTSADPVGAKTDQVPSANTCLGYTFKGWAYTPDAVEPVYKAGNWEISDLESFFEVGQIPEYTTTTDGGTVVRTLYAVWEVNNQNNTVYVYKDVPAPGNQTQEFGFNVNISATYNGNNSLAETGRFTLKHNQYAVLYTSQDANSNPVNITMSVTLYNAEDDTRVNPEKGDAPDYTFVAERSTNTLNRTFTNINIVVAEENDANYTTTMKRIAQSEGTIQLDGTQISADPVTVEGRRINWTRTDQSGTVIYTNTRQTADVTVKKLLVGENAGTFRFNGSYVADGKTTDVDEFAVSAGSSVILEDIPVGAVLTLTEEIGTEYDVETGFANGSADTNTDGKVVSFTVPSEGETVTYTNTLKSYPVRIVKVDQDGNSGVEARFNLTRGAATVLSGKDTTPTNNVIYDGNLYVGTYTLTESWVQSQYIGLDKPVALTLTGDGSLTSDNAHAVVSGDKDNGFAVTVYNLATVEITITKVLNDLLTTREFAFTGSYSTTLNGETISGNLSIPAISGGSSQKVTVPVGAELTVTEQDTYNAYAIYDTTVTMEDVDGEEITDTNTDEHSFTGTVSKAGTLTFVNTRKNPVIKLHKVDDKGADLKGARFKLYVQNETSTYVVYNVTEKDGIVGPGESSDATNEIDMTLVSAKNLQLPNGSYKLVETEAPAGHIILSSGIEFTVLNGRVTLTPQSGVTLDTYEAVTANQYILTVENMPGAALPSTGGPGTHLIYLLGIIFTSLAGSGLLMKRRRRNVA